MESTYAPRASVSASSYVQVCDRCRWKKIKCDAPRPCTNCRQANFPCESRARLSKQSTPRSYVQYLETRVRQLEQGQENEWSPRASSAQNSPYGNGVQTKNSVSPSSSLNGKRVDPPDWTVLKELGMQVVDEDGIVRYMGPSSGVGFSTMALQEVMGDGCPNEPGFNGLFTVDDFTRGKALEQADFMLCELDPTRLPDRSEVQRLLKTFFIFTERVFPVLHRPSFEAIIEELYGQERITAESYEQLAQFYFCLSVGACFDLPRTRDDRIRDQICFAKLGYKCHFSTLHRRGEGLARIQTLALQSYALIMLRQRSEAVRISAMANMKVLEIGLHHDGKSFAGNPLETQMRRRVFWCVFMLHLFSSVFLGLPRALHEADINIDEPSDVDDECLTTTQVLNAFPGRTRIHRFVTVCRLVRILSRTMDVLYTHSKRKHATTRIEQMNRLCCEHLLDQLDFSFNELPDDLPEPDSQDPHEMAVAISYANEQLLYHYIRWLIHRPGLALARTEAQFASCLQVATEAASAMLELLEMYAHLLPFIKSSPVAHPMTIFMAALTPLYHAHIIRSQPMTLPTSSNSMDDDFRAVQHGIGAIRNEPYDKHDLSREDLLTTMVSIVWGPDAPPVQVQRFHSDRSIVKESSISLAPPISSLSAPPSTYRLPPRTNGTYMDWSEHRIAHLTAHQDLRDLVHDVFSPAIDPWATPADHNSSSAPYPSH